MIISDKHKRAVWAAVLLFALHSSLFTLTSCLKNNNDLFEENSSTRLTEFLNNATDVITDGDATWMMEMYPSSSQSLGGYVFTFRFTSDSVYCHTEFADSTAEVGSLWHTTRDNGPVLSLDTYNTFAHLLSTPSASLYQAYYGEFEWVITDVQQNLITLRGKKTGNTIYMRRMTESPESYLNKIAYMKNSMTISGLQGNIDGDSLSVAINTDTRQITFSDAESTYASAYCYTPEGIRLYKTLTINKAKITALTADFDATGAIVGMTTNTGDKFTAVYPDGYRKFADYIGDYTMYYYLTLPSSSVRPIGYKKVDVSLVAADNGSTFYLKGLNPNYDVVMTYKKSTGTLDLSSQLVLDATTHQYYKSANGYYIGCIAWYATSATTGYVSYATTVGMTGKWKTSEKSNIEIDFTDNGIWQAGYTVNSFRFYYFNSETMSDNTRISVVTNSAEYIQGTYKSNSMPFLKTMVMK